MTSDLLTRRPLECALFGRPVFAAHTSTVAEVEAVLDAASGVGDALLVLRLPTDALGVAQRVEQAGGRLCDILLTMSRPLHTGYAAEHAPAAGYIVRRGAASDASALHAIGEHAFHGSRTHWHLDDRLPGALADTLYARWAADLARAATDERPVFVAESSDGDIAGFLALASAERGRWHVPLTAVDPRHQGRGLVRALLTTAMQTVAAHGATGLDYETQLSNRAALRSVAQCGLAPSTSRLTFHLWTTPR